MSDKKKLYAERDIEALDRVGNYYVDHVLALTAEGLYSKSDIAAELAHRDYIIDKIIDAVEDMVKEDVIECMDLLKAIKGE